MQHLNHFYSGYIIINFELTDSKILMHQCWEIMINDSKKNSVMQKIPVCRSCNLTMVLAFRWPLNLILWRGWCILLVSISSFSLSSWRFLYSSWSRIAVMCLSRVSLLQVHSSFSYMTSSHYIRMFIIRNA